MCGVGSNIFFARLLSLVRSVNATMIGRLLLANAAGDARIACRDGNLPFQFEMSMTLMFVPAMLPLFACNVWVTNL